MRRRAVILLAVCAGLLAGGGYGLAQARVAPHPSVAGHRPGAAAGAAQPQSKKKVQAPKGKRFKAKNLPFTGTGVTLLTIVGVGLVGAGSALVMLAHESRGLGWALRPAWNSMVRMAACGYPLDADVFDLEGPSP